MSGWYGVMMQVSLYKRHVIQRHAQPRKKPKLFFSCDTTVHLHVSCGVTIRRVNVDSRDWLSLCKRVLALLRP